MIPFSWLKQKILIYFEDWLTTIEVRPSANEKSEKQRTQKSMYILSWNWHIEFHMHKVYA